MVLCEEDEMDTKNLCFRCVGEPYISAEIEREGVCLECSYCGNRDNSYLIDKMAERIESVFDQHYCRTSNEPDALQCMMLSDRESDYDWERDGESTVDAIMNLADMPKEAAQDIQQILGRKYANFDYDAMGEETEFSEEACYEEKETSDAAWQQKWRSFEKSLKTEARFFSRSGISCLEDIFDGIEKLSTRDDRPLVVNAGPGTDLSVVYRARVFQSDDKLKDALCRPNEHLGPPPAFSASAGRMNAHGISVFYGANDPMAAIAEVRPPVGSQVAVAQFEIIQPLRLLDLTALNDIKCSGSTFDPEFASQLERVMFLRSLSQRMARPVMPDDEAFEYLPTQAVADFLATKKNSPLDGIMFPSAQVSGDIMNVVLFHKAARVESVDFPAGIDISASTGCIDEDGWRTEFEVQEELPLPVTEKPATRKEAGRWPSFSGLAKNPWAVADSDRRKPSLRAIIDSVRVHVIRRVEVTTDDYPVSRHRMVKREPDF